MSATSPGSGSLQREVFRFALAGILTDPMVGTRPGSSLYADVAFFGLHINDDGTNAV